jgi:hypothetical protein
MDYRVNSFGPSKDKIINIARGEVITCCARRLMLLTGIGGVTGTGNGSDSTVRLGLIGAPEGWRIVGIGAFVVAKGADTKQESITWGFGIGDIGAQDLDAFGSVVCVATSNKEWEAGDFMYQGIAPFEDFFKLDALASAGAHVWDISGTGAGVQMGVWQYKAAMLTVTKANVADSTATVVPFMLVEYNAGGGEL